MSAVAAPRAPAPELEHPEAVGPIGRLGAWTVDRILPDVSFGHS